MVYPALLPLMRTPRLSVVDWTDAPCRFKCTRPFRRKTKSGFCACAFTFQTRSTTELAKCVFYLRFIESHWCCLTGVTYCQCQLGADLQFIPGPLNLLRRAGSFETVWSACWRHEIQNTEWRMINFMFIVPCIIIPYILWNNQQMHLYAVNFIPLLGSLYMFRVFYTPIIRSTIFNCIYSHWYKP